MEWMETEVKNLPLNPFVKLDNDWMLITAGDAKKCNTMTASWGGFGVLWNKNVATIYIRPQRHTLSFVEQNDCFTLSFFNHAKYKEALMLCGTKSGKDIDKIKEAHLTPKAIMDTVAFEEAELVLVCKKLYKDVLTPENFIDASINEEVYPTKDHHFIFIAEIVGAFCKDKAYCSSNC